MDLIGERITLITNREAGVDEFNEPIYITNYEFYDNVVVAAAVGGPFKEDNTPERNIIEGKLTLHFTHDPYPNIQPTDLVQTRGMVYEVDGFPFEWRDPFTDSSFGLSVNLKRTRG